MSEATQTVAAGQLRAFIERIERLEEERQTIAADIRDVKAEAKGTGFSVPTINAILKLRKKDQAEREEAEALLDTYLAALGMLPQGDLFDAGSSNGRTSAFEAEDDGSNPSLATTEQPETAKEVRAEPPRRGLSEVTLPTTCEEHPLSGGEGTQGTGSASVPGSITGQSTNLEQAAASSSALEAGPVPTPSQAGPAVDLHRVNRDQLLRPGCRRPGSDDCGGAGTKLCHACRSAAAEQREVA